MLMEGKKGSLRPSPLIFMQQLHSLTLYSERLLGLVLGEELLKTEKHSRLSLVKNWLYIYGSELCKFQGLACWQTSSYRGSDSVPLSKLGISNPRTQRAITCWGRCVEGGMSLMERASTAEFSLVKAHFLALKLICIPFKIKWVGVKFFWDGGDHLFL